ncbi:MAG TPA: hypothetical protein VF765_13720 [Polyangiaceae bacterium]
MRGRVGARTWAALLGSLTILCAGCAPDLTTHWTCDYDASENRPLSDPDAMAGPDGSLSAAVCQTTCGPPVNACTRTVLDGGQAGAVCPVCTF